MNQTAAPSQPPPGQQGRGQDRSESGGSSPREPLQLANEQGQRIQELVEEIERLTDPTARNLAQDCIHALLAFYGTGLENILRVVEDASVTSQNAYQMLVTDPVARGLLLIHGLHPTPLETRLQEALNKVRPYMRSHGGNVELVSFEDGRALLRLAGACDTCASSAVTMELALRQAIEEICPDLAGFEVEGGQPAVNGTRKDGSAPAKVRLEGALELENGTFLTVKTANIPLIICKAAAQLYAYRDQCPICNLPLHLGAMEGTTFRCGEGHLYSVLRAGQSLQRSGVHLDPFPLTLENGTAEVSVM